MRICWGRSLVVGLLVVTGLVIPPISSAAAAPTQAPPPLSASLHPGLRPPAPLSYQYYPMTCAGHWGDLNAAAYMNTSPSDYAWCPIWGMFGARHNYAWSWGYDSYVWPSMGWVVVNQHGDGCSTDAPDAIDGVFDFTISCRAHDYCYDLRRAGFTGTVSIADCDQRFHDISNAHCTGRFSGGLNRSNCLAASDGYYYSVGLFGSADADPAIVRLENWIGGTYQCLNVYGGGGANTPVVQGSCFPNFAGNDRWRIWPATGAPGYFWIKATHTDHCLSEYYTSNFNTGDIEYVYQAAPCLAGYTHQQFRIQGSYNQDKYTLRVVIQGLDDCVNVPGARADWNLQMVTFPCHEVINDTWYVKWP